MFSVYRELIDRMLIAVCTLMLTASIAFAATLDVDKFLSGRARYSIIKLGIVGQTIKNNKGKIDQRASTATGFFISETGYALTAAHSFFKDDDFGNPGKKLYAISGVDFITGRIGSASAPLRIFSLVDISQKHDVALIKLIDSESEHQRFLPGCSGFVSRNADLVGVGFDLAEGMDTPPGRIRSGLQGDVIPINIDLVPGMSGGPILDDKGQVVGLAVGGIKGGGVQRLNLMLAMQFMEPEFGVAKASTDCSENLDLGDLEEKKVMYDQLIAEARDESSTDVAMYKYEKAAELKSDGWQAFYGMAHIDFENGDFAHAAILASKAFQVKRPTDFTLLNFVALTNDARGDLEQAIKDYKSIITNVERNTALYKDALFSLGQVELEEFIGGKQSDGNSDLLKNAESNFSNYLKIGGFPTHFAFYHLACAHAIENARSEAISDWDQAKTALLNYRGGNRDHHIELFNLSLTASRDIHPGDPIICPALQQLLKSNQISGIAK